MMRCFTLKKKVFLHELILKERWGGDYYDPSYKETVVTTSDDATELRQAARHATNPDKEMYFFVRTSISYADSASVKNPRPEYFVDVHEPSPLEDVCGQIVELQRTGEFDVAYAYINGTAKEHMHNLMTETYFITKGTGVLYLAKKPYDVSQGDSINIPKGVPHFLKGNLEALVITAPKYIPEDVILIED
jgi:mannose-6-phosphate isomerase-like protein (cupin superfamily)